MPLKDYEKRQGERTYKFADFILEVGQHRLRRGDLDIRLPPKTFDMLLYLVERPDRLIRKNELLNDLWNDAIVSESALTHRIEQVRKALNDDAQNPRYIQTVSGLGYKFTASVEIVAGAAESSPVPMESPSSSHIAVLPFVNIGADPENQYFCDGLAEDLINALAKIKRLRVAARTSTFSFRDKNADIKDIGRTLNVGTVLEGSVRRSGKKLRITAQLINVADGFHLWSERFDRKMKDVFVIQDEIVLTIVEKLKLGLLEDEREKIVKRYTTNKRAYDLFLRGRYYWNRRYKGDLIKAVDCYERAIAKDPNYALPYVGISNVFNILGMWAYIHPHEASQRTKTALRKALDIDDSLGEIYSSLGYVTASYEWDFKTSHSLYRRGIELNPSDSLAHAWLAIVLMVDNKFNEALSEIRAAIAADPMFSILQSLQSCVLAYAGRIEEAREVALKAVAMNPDQPMSHLFLGMAYMKAPSLPDKAIEALEKAVSFGLIFALGWLGMAYALAGRTGDARRTLARLEAMERESFLPPLARFLVRLKPGLKSFRSLKRKYVSPLLKAMIYIGLNEHEKGLDELTKSVAERDYFAAAILWGIVDIDRPCWRRIVSDPRFNALKGQIKRSRALIEEVDHE